MPDLAVCTVCGLHSFGIPHELSYSFALLHLSDGSKDLWSNFFLYFPFLCLCYFKINQSRLINY